MKNQTARFTCSVVGTILNVFARKTKRGINVAVRQKTTGQKAKTGARTLFAADQETEAIAEFNRLVSDAEKRGWTVATRVARARKMAFTEIPTAPVANAETKAESVSAKTASTTKADLVAAHQAAKRKSA